MRLNVGGAARDAASVLHFRPSVMSTGILVQYSL